MISVLVEPEGAEAYFFSQLQDVTEQRRAERQKAVIADLGRRALESTDAVALMADAMHVVRETLGSANCLTNRCLVSGSSSARRRSSCSAAARSRAPAMTWATGLGESGAARYPA